MRGRRGSVHKRAVAGHACTKARQRTPTTTGLPSGNPELQQLWGTRSRRACKLQVGVRGRRVLCVPAQCQGGSHACNHVPGPALLLNHCRHFFTLEDCCKHLKEVEGCEVVGIEIADGARPVHTHPFKGPTAFMLGNEGQGMTERQVSGHAATATTWLCCEGLEWRTLRPAAWYWAATHAHLHARTQMALCDSFVYIPQVRGCVHAHAASGAPAFTLLGARRLTASAAGPVRMLHVTRTHAHTRTHACACVYALLPMHARAARGRHCVAQRGRGRVHRAAPLCAVRGSVGRPTGRPSPGQGRPVAQLPACVAEAAGAWGALSAAESEVLRCARPQATRSARARAPSSWWASGRCAGRRAAPWRATQRR